MRGGGDHLPSPPAQKTALWQRLADYKIGPPDAAFTFTQRLARENRWGEEYTARVVTEAAVARLPIMLEPFMSRWVDGKIVNDLSTDAVALSVAIASGLGASSAYTWMKLPVVDDMERVMSATTLPTLLLGGDSGADPDDTFATWQDALALPGVRGLTVGRTLLYPPGGDVAAAVDIAAGLVHGDL